MIHPYQTERGARARAATLGLGSTVTQARGRGWLAVGPVEIDSAGRRDRALYGTNRAAWSVTRELDEIRARGADAPASWSAIERELCALLTHPTPAEIRAEERAERIARNRAIDAAAEARWRAEALEEAQQQSARAQRVAARSAEIEEITTQIEALRRDLSSPWSAQAALCLRLSELEEREDVAYWRANLAAALEDDKKHAALEAEEAAREAERRAHIAAEFSDLHAGSIVSLPGHEHPVRITAYDGETHTVTVERTRGMVTYDVFTGRVVTEKSRTESRET
jgi:chromosome segregation ATPase